MSFVGTPYVWGGEGPGGFDCSGLVQEILRSIGADPRLDQTAQGLFNFFVTKPTIGVKPCFGALAFYGSDEKGITHVGFCLNAKVMLSSTGGGKGVNIPTSRAMVTIRPVNYRKDLVKVIRPKYDIIY